VKRQAGLSKFEFAVVLAIFGVLAHILLDRLTALEQETERLEVSLVIRHINIGLKLAIGERIMRGQEARISELLAENPLNFLGQQNRKVDAGDTPATPGSWRFDAASRILSYTPRQPEAFDNQARLTWRLTAHPDDLGRLASLRVEPLK
jgi:hypothetical protein